MGQLRVIVGSLARPNAGLDASFYRVMAASEARVETNPGGGTGGRELIILRVVQFGLLFVATLVVARELGPSGRAQFVLPLAAAAVAGAIAHLSLGNAAVRLISRREASLVELAGPLYAAMLPLSVLATTATFAYCELARRAVADASALTIIFAAATVPPTLVAQISGTLLIAIGDAIAGAWAMILGTLVQLAALAIWLLFSGLSPAVAMGLALVGQCAAAVFITVTLGRRVGASALRLRWSRSLGGPLLANAVRMHPGGLALQLGSRVDLLIVGALASARSSGLYSLALSLASSAYLITQTLSQSALHTQMHAAVAAASEFTARFTRQALALALATTTVACALAYPFITLVFGSAWRGSVVPFMVLVVATIAIAIEEPVRQMLFRVGRPVETSSAACASVVVNAVATLVLYQALGITGAAIGSIVAFWVYAAIMVTLLVRASGMSARDIVALPRRGDPLFEWLRTTVLRRNRVPVT